MMMSGRDRFDRDPVDLERSSRSVFVGNIPYEASEEQLKDIFSEVGPVLNFRLVFDRESGKPKGYGFAEYQDQETAMSAMRNLNNRELHGRTLRVDHATSEKNKMLEEMQALGGIGPPRESSFGDPVPPKDAPEAISKAVASLPPEQMFELMKQMKQCIQNNPVEARNMLLQNPQLAYALLQAQVVMRIVDPEIAMKMLHRQNPAQTLIPVGQASDTVDRPNGVPPPTGPNRDPGNERRMGAGPPGPMDVLPPGPRRREGSPPLDRIEPRGPMDHTPPPHMLEPRRGPPDDRMGIEMGRGEPMGPRDHPVDRKRGPPIGINRGPEPPHRSPDAYGRAPFGRPDPRDPMFQERGVPREGMGGIPGIGAGPPMDGRRGPGNDRGPMPPHGGDQRGPPRDARGPPIERGGSDPRRIGGPGLNQRGAPMPPQGDGPVPGLSAMPDLNNPDQEKAALIMQVLQLTPEQIAMLPEEQRKSILILKEQITGGRH